MTERDTMDIEAMEAAREVELATRKRENAQLDRDLTEIMTMFGGRRFIWDLTAPMWRTSFDGTTTGTEFREGERNVALRVWARLIQVCPTLAHKMQEENQR